MWTRKVLHAEYEITAYATGAMDAHDKFINARQVLSELIASKDAEIAKLTGERDRQYDDNVNRIAAEGAAIVRAEKAESEIASKDAEIGRLRNVAKVNCDIANDCASELATLRAENEPPAGYKHIKLACKNTIFDFHRLNRPDGTWILLDGVNVNVTPKAAERNTAGPGPWPGDPDHRETMPVDTAPVVEVTVDSGMDAEAVEQAELFWAQLPVNRKWISIPTHEKALVCHLLSTYRTEAEARGRREALECAQYIAEHVDDATTAKALQPIIDELKRLMTERK